MIFYASTQEKAWRRQRSMNSGQAHFITSSEKGVSEPNWVGIIDRTLYTWPTALSS